MQIHIAPIGINTEHVIQWIKETTPIEKIWLIHSKQGKEDFPKIAKELSNKIKSFYEDCQIDVKIIENSFGIDDTMDKIQEIVFEEESTNPNIERKDFLINVTGGTNSMAAAAILSATLLGTKAHYIKDKRQDKKSKKFVIELPIPPLGIAKMNKTYQNVLEKISNGYFMYDKKNTGSNEKRGPGIITNKDLLKSMKWDKTVDSGKRIRKIGATNLRAIIKKLESLGYIRIIKGVPQMKKVSLGYGKYEWREGVNQAEVMYEITPLGKRQSKNIVMLDNF